MKSSSHKHRKNSVKSSVHRRHQKNKSKKRRCRDASISYSDSDARSESSQSISTDSGEDSRGRGTTRAQDVRKRTMKRVRCSPFSSSEDACSARRRRRRHRNRSKSESKRIRGLNKRKKPIKRKHMTARSPSSSSCPSCSTCGDSSSSTDIEIERSRRLDTGKFGSRGRSHHRERTQTKRYRSQSRSSSSCSGCRTSSYRWSRERSVEKSIPRRLGSVVTVVKDLKEQDEDKDENKAEIIPAYDDCPSSRSNDSYDGGRKRESATLLSSYSSQHASEKRGQTDEKVKSGNDGGGPKAAWDDPPLMEKKNEVCGDVGSLENEDLESMLRKKALENLKRFRNGLANSRCTVDMKDEQGVSKQVMAKVESIQSGHAKKAVVSGDIKSTVGLQNCVNNRHDPHLKLAINPLPDGSAGTNNKSIQGAFESRPNSTCDQSIRHHVHHKKSELSANAATGARAAAACWKEGLSVEREELALHKSSEKKLLEQSLGEKDVPGKKIAEISKAAAATSVRSAHDTQGREGNGSVPIASSQLDPKVEDHGAVLELKTKEAEGSSQYEQKTMSVMRGGEMVQVSYKVYIPKKPPALARRKLQR